MPLMQSKSKGAVGKNISTEMHAGKPQKQAIAIALEVQRRNRKAKGGMIHPMMHEDNEHEHSMLEMPHGYCEGGMTGYHSGGYAEGGMMEEPDMESADAQTESTHEAMPDHDYHGDEEFLSEDEHEMPLIDQIMKSFKSKKMQKMMHK